MHPNPIKLRIRSIEVLNMFNYRLCVTNEKIIANYYAALMNYQQNAVLCKTGAVITDG